LEELHNKRKATETELGSKAETLESQLRLAQVKAFLIGKEAINAARETEVELENRHRVTMDLKKELDATAKNAASLMEELARLAGELQSMESLLEEERQGKASLEATWREMHSKGEGGMEALRKELILEREKVNLS